MHIDAMGLLPAAADSARVVEHVYAVSLTTLAPIAIAGIATAALRRSQAASRVAVLRAAVVAMLIVYLGALLPGQRIAWIVPVGFAQPLIALGRIEMTGPLAKLVEAQAPHGDHLLIRLLFVAYIGGVVIVLIPFVRGTIGLMIQTRRAARVSDPRLLQLLRECQSMTGVAQTVDLRADTAVDVPMTWGVLRPTILIPSTCAESSDARVRAVLLHELWHVRARDAAFMTLGRIACAALWFSPGAWWIDRRLRTECELACDDSVLALGVRQTDYAELLVDSCERLHQGHAPRVAMAIADRGGLRERLRSIVDPVRHLRRRSQLPTRFAVSITLVIATIASGVRLAPTRGVLDSLMRDARWESRAYAVLGLAQRPDSIEVARSAAASDPDPKVRALARYAVSLEPAAALDRAAHHSY